VKLLASPNIFVPMATNAPPQQISSRGDHVVKKIGIIDQNKPVDTNKFHANFFLGSQGNSVWTHPYSLSWAKGRGDTWGMAVSHVERSQFAWGPGAVPQYFIGPIGIQHIVFSAAELGEKTTLSTEAMTAFSVYANLAPSPGAAPVLSLPCVQVSSVLDNSIDKHC
jgi:endo-1,3(4)-beta-glucanase